MGDICGRELRARALKLCTFLHNACGRCLRGLPRGATVLPPAASAAPGRQSGSWGAWGRADKLPDTAGAASADGGELPEGGAGMMRGGECFAVRLLRVGHVLCGVLHVGEHVLGDPTWRPLSL